MKLEKRQYQTRAVKNLRRDLAEAHRVLAVSPAGSGKTVIASMLLKSEGRWRKVLWLAHRYELVDQAYTTLTELGLDVGIVMAQEEALRGPERANPRARVQVASVQSIASRGVPKDVDLIIVDEAHRAMADSYQDIAQSCGNADVLGLTATPCRMDGRGLGEFFSRLRTVAQPSDLQADGYQAKPRSFAAGAEVLAKLAKDLKGTHPGADFSQSAMTRAVDNGLLIGRVVAEAMRLAPELPKVVFACSVAHSKRIAEGFRAAGVASAHVDAHTPPGERESILADLRCGLVEVVSNVDVLSEGWDLPELGAVILARPTKSLPRYLQMVGRVQRYYGRERPLVIDHGGNIHRFDILPGEDIPWVLEQGVQVGRDDDDPKLKECPECQAVLPWGTAECFECGEQIGVEKTPRQEREEVEARLEEITRADLDTRRGIAEELAIRENAPPGWADKVVRKMTAARGG